MDENQIKLLVSLKFNLQYTCLVFDALIASMSAEDADYFNRTYTELAENLAKNDEKEADPLADSEKK